MVTTGEVMMSQICDNQFYVKTIHKIRIHEPGRILVLATAYPPNPKSTLYSLIEEHVAGVPLVPTERKYWSETAGLDYVKELSFKEDAEATKVATEGSFYATSSFAAVSAPGRRNLGRHPDQVKTMKYLELECQYRIVPHSLRIRYQPSEDTMMIDVSAIQSLELIQNLRNSKSQDCLYGLLNRTRTPMGARMLRNNILQPPTLADAFMTTRYDAVEELTTNEDMFIGARDALKGFMDIEKLLTNVSTMETTGATLNILPAARRNSNSDHL
jgi:DNA mismatch repair protein MSH4